MPYYKEIDTTTANGKRTAERLLVLKDALNEIPTKTVDDTFSWPPGTSGTLISPPTARD